MGSPPPPIHAPSTDAVSDGEEMEDDQPLSMEELKARLQRQGGEGAAQQQSHATQPPVNRVRERERERESVCVCVRCLRELKRKKERKRRRGRGIEWEDGKGAVRG